MKIKRYFSIDSLDKKQEISENLQKGVNFLNYDNIKQSKDISKEFYEKQIKEFKEKNPSGYKILQKMRFFLEKNKLINTKSILATKLFIEELQKENKEGKIKIYLKVKPAKLVSLIKWFYDDVEKEEELAKKEEKLVKKEEKLVKKNEKLTFIKQEKIKQKEFSKEEIHQIVLKLQNQISQQAPEYEDKITQQTEQIKKQYPYISEDKAYLLSVAKLRKENPDFASKLQLDVTTQAVLKSVENEFSNLKLDKIVSQQAIETKINNFVNEKTNFDETIAKQFEVDEKLDLSFQKLLSKKYKDLVDENFNEFVLKNEWKINVSTLETDYKKYLNWQQTKFNELFNKIGYILYKKFKQDTKSFIKDYKQIALTEYTKAIFKLFDESVGTEKITKEFNTENFNIEKNWEIELKFKYQNTPLKFVIRPDGRIYMTNYLAKKNQNPDKIISNTEEIYEVKETRLNNLFNFVSLQNILTPEKIDWKNILAKNWNLKDILNWEFKRQIESKLEENNKLWNKELMKAEVKYEMEVQNLTHKLLSIYRPPVDNKYLNAEGWKIENGWIFTFLQKFENTINTKENTFDVLNKLLSNDRFKQLTETSLWDWENQLTTYKLFQQLHFLTWDWKLNLGKIDKFISKLEKISSVSDLSNLPPIENYKWELDNNKLKLVKDNPDEELETALWQVIPNYSSIEV